MQKNWLLDSFVPLCKEYNLQGRSIIFPTKGIEKSEHSRIPIH